MLRVIWGALLIALLWTSELQAVELFEWHDAAGITHYTDNEVNVPTEYRKGGKRNVGKLQITGGRIERKQANSLGESVWQDKCISCHTIGANQGSKIGLSQLLINSKSNSPATMNEVVAMLSRASRGDLPKMAKVALSPKEIKYIAEFLLGSK